MFAVSLLIFAVSLVGEAQTTKTDANLNQLAEAAGAIQENRLPPVEEILNAVLVTSPHDADALNLLGVVRAKIESSP